MNLTISGQHLEITPAIRSHVESKLDRMKRNFDGVIDISVLLAVDNVSDKEKSQRAEIRLNLSGKTLHCGSEKYLMGQGISIPEEVRASLETLRSQGKASVIATGGGVCAGVIAMSDVLRPDAKSMIEELHKTHTSAVLLTGDNRRTAEYFAGKVGISKVRADLLPEEKVSNLVQMQQEGKVLCMIGDGVNDAPALKTASVGVAMGGLGSDIAVEASDIVLMSDDIAKIPYLKRLSNGTVKTIKLSIMLSLCINFFAILASLMGWLTPTTGALVHNAGSVLVVLIAALLYDRKFD